jgi:hypothetical protein
MLIFKLIFGSGLRYFSLTLSMIPLIGVIPPAELNVRINYEALESSPLNEVSSDLFVLLFYFPSAKV